jgi:hypothetical protein
MVAWTLRAGLALAALFTLALAASPTAAAQDGGQVLVSVEVTPDEQLASPLYQAIRVVVTDPATGAPRLELDEVVARATNAEGQLSEVHTLQPEVIGQGGAYHGVVILPHTGTWTVVVTVADLPPAGGRTGPAVIRGEGTVDVLVTNGRLESGLAAGAAPGAVQGGTPQGVLPVIMLWLHSLAAIGWTAAVGLLMATTHPATAGEFRGDMVERWLVRALDARRLTTVAILATGLYNLRFELAFKHPTPANLHSVLQLPYARLYFTAFWLKLILYALLLVASVPVASAARERLRQGRVLVTPAGATIGAADDGWPSDDWLDDPVGDATVELRRARWSVRAMTFGGAGMLLAVTALKYVHLLVEASRAR